MLNKMKIEENEKTSHLFFIFFKKKLALETIFKTQ